MSETGTAFLLQLSFACRLDFSRYDGCQTPVVKTQRGRSDFDLGSLFVVVPQDRNSALDFHFGPSLFEVLNIASLLALSLE